MVRLWKTVAILWGILRIECDNGSFRNSTKLLLNFRLEIVSEWIGKSWFWLCDIFFVFLDDIRVTGRGLAWFVIIFWVWLIRCYGGTWIFEGIKRERSMNFSFWNVRIRIVIILGFCFDDFDFFLIHEIEWIFELCRWVNKQKYLWVS